MPTARSLLSVWVCTTHVETLPYCTSQKLNYQFLVKSMREFPLHHCCNVNTCNHVTTYIHKHLSTVLQCGQPVGLVEQQVWERTVSAQIMKTFVYDGCHSTQLAVSLGMYVLLMQNLTVYVQCVKSKHGEIPPNTHTGQGIYSMSTCTHTGKAPQGTPHCISDNTEINSIDVCIKYICGYKRQQTMNTCLCTVLSVTADVSSSVTCVTRYKDKCSNYMHNFVG